MNYCPCCSNVLLRHIRSHEVYWFCRNCWQPMPVYNVRKDYLSPITLVNPLAQRHKESAKLWHVTQLANWEVGSGEEVRQYSSVKGERGKV